MISLSWTDQSLISMDEIVEWYENKVNTSFADSAKNKITNQIFFYTKPPLSPNSLPDSDFYAGWKKLVIDGFPLIAYLRHIQNEEWEIMDVIHTSRKIPK
jgi:plasmid stabilization system protein ParE